MAAGYANSIRGVDAEPNFGGQATCGPNQGRLGKEKEWSESADDIPFALQLTSASTFPPLSGSIRMFLRSHRMGIPPEVAPSSVNESEQRREDVSSSLGLWRERVNDVPS